MHAIDAITYRDLTVTPGVRVEALRTTFSDYKAGTVSRALTNAVLPGAGAFYSIVPSFGVLGGVYRGFSPPTPESAAYGGKELSVNYEAGARFVHRRARAELIGFYNDYQNLTDLCTENSGCAAVDKQFNAGAARIYGLEAFATHAIPVVDGGRGLSIPFTAAYTLTHSEFLSSFHSDDPIFGDVHQGDEIPYVPRHTINASVGVDTRPVSGAIAMNYVSAMRELAGSAALEHTIATDDVLTFDVSLTYRPLRWLSVYGNVRNVFDEQAIVSRRPFGARPNAPRWAQLGVKATFD
jgi:Fe(3+) dicitrate transport protein